MSSFLFGAKPEGIDRDEGIIKGVAIVTEGEARGHGVNLDAEFVQETVRLGNEKKSGLKVRFGHPNMSSTALGTFLGRAKNFRVDRSGEDRALARADIHLSETAEEAPQGNLYDYTLAMASKEADMFGSSIVFKGGKTFVKKDGKKVYDYYEATPLGRAVKDEYKDEPVFIEMAKLYAADLVDDPAANPSGLFQAPSGLFAGQITEFFDTHHEVWEYLAQHKEIVPSFLGRYESYLARKRTVDTVSDGMPSEKTDKTRITELETSLATVENRVKELDGQLAAKDTELKAAQSVVSVKSVEFTDATNSSATLKADLAAKDKQLTVATAKIQESVDLAKTATESLKAFSFTAKQADTNFAEEGQRVIAAIGGEFPAYIDRLASVKAAQITASQGIPPIPQKPADPGKPAALDKLFGLAAVEAAFKEQIAPKS
jgi:uncharacterized coiled-coil protein SlyX